MCKWVTERMIMCTCVSSFLFSSVSSGVRGSASSIFACSSFWTCAEFGISGLRGIYNKHTNTVTYCFRTDASSAKAWVNCARNIQYNHDEKKAAHLVSNGFPCSKESPSPAAQRDVVERTESPGCWAAWRPRSLDHIHHHTHTHTPHNTHTHTHTTHTHHTHHTHTHTTHTHTHTHTHHTHTLTHTPTHTTHTHTHTSYPHTLV